MREIKEYKVWEEVIHLTSSRMVLFGASRYANIFFRNMKNKVALEKVVDNDPRKWNQSISDIIGKSHMFYDMIIDSPISLEKVPDKEEVVIIIASVHVKDIEEQAEKMGFSQFIPVIELNGEFQSEFGGQGKLAEKYLDLPICKHKVLCVMGFFGGHPKYITQKLLKYKELDIVWSVKNAVDDIPKSVRIVNEGDWDRYYKELETAHVIMYESTLPIGYVKKKGQIIIQTKHWSSITLKRFYLEDKLYMAKPNKMEQQKKEAKMMDYILTGSEFDESSCRSGFGFEGTFVRVGSPRSDALFNKEMKKKICDFYNLKLDTRFFMYAPTFRSNPNEGVGKYVAYDWDTQIDLRRVRISLKNKFGGEWICLRRSHPIVAVGASEKEYDKCIIDTRLYGDSMELVAASDVIITDYSSIMFEPAYVGKPVFLYAPDKEHYIREERDLLINYDTLPFPISKNNDELITQIEQFDEENYSSKVEKFLQIYGVHEDGRASERAAEFIMELIGK